MKRTWILRIALWAVIIFSSPLTLALAEESPIFSSGELMGGVNDYISEFLRLKLGQANEALGEDAVATRGKSMELLERAEDLAFLIAHAPAAEFNPLYLDLLVRYKSNAGVRAPLDLLLGKIIQQTAPEIAEQNKHGVFTDALSGAVDGAFWGMTVVSLSRSAVSVSRFGFARQMLRWARINPERMPASFLDKLGPWKQMLLGVGSGAVLGMATEEAIFALSTKKIDPALTLHIWQAYILFEEYALRACLWKQRRWDLEADSIELNLQENEIKNLLRDVQEFDKSAPQFKVNQRLNLKSLDKILANSAERGRVREEFYGECGIKQQTMELSTTPVIADLSEVLETIHSVQKSAHK